MRLPTAIRRPAAPLPARRRPRPPPPRASSAPQAARTAADAAPISAATQRAFDQVAARGGGGQQGAFRKRHNGWDNEGWGRPNRPVRLFSVFLVSPNPRPRPHFFSAAGAGGATTLDALRRADAGWASLCAAHGVRPRGCALISLSSSCFPLDRSLQPHPPSKTPRVGQHVGGGVALLAAAAAGPSHRSSLHW